MTSTITELVRSATVVIADGVELLGSGFFVAPDRVLTCAHVVHGRARVSVRWNGAVCPAEILSRVPAVPGADGGNFDAPDTAVLSVPGFGAHPVVPLGLADPVVDDKVFVFGMTGVRTGKPERDGALLRFSERVGARDELFKLTRGQIAKGQSGGPVLNMRTREVCGMTKQGRPAERGGYAIPIADALASWAGENLWAANQECHNEGMEALRRAQSGFGELPSRVATLIEQRHIGGEFEQRLAALDLPRPAGVADGDRDEWVARQLFTLQLRELIDLLDPVVVALERVGLEILHLVGCCLPVNDSYWVPSDAATALRVEWSEELPRVVRVATECPETAQLMALRAIYRRVRAGRMLPFSAECGPDGLPTDLVEDVFGELARYNVDSASWPARRTEVLGVLGTNAPVFYLDGRALADTAVLAPLLSRFGGFRFMIISRDPVAEQESEYLVDLRPPGDRFYEGLALGLLRDIEERIGVAIGAA